MSQIRCVYSEAPKFPATDQHPNAKRYTVGNYVVDAIGVPTQAEVDAIVNPPPPPEKLTLESLAAKLVEKGVLTTAEIEAAKDTSPAHRSDDNL